MDQFTLMCSKLEELQKEWEPESGDLWYDGEEEYSTRMYCSGCEGEGIDDHPFEITPHIWLPTMEQMMEMMPEIPYWKMEVYNEEIKQLYVYLQLKEKSLKGFYSKANDIKCTMLQALAWARWGKEWDEEKEEWK